MSKVPTEKLGKLATTVASAFYPAATQLYSEGDTAFARCVDCVSYPVITKDQDSKFEKIPYAFGKENKGISFIKAEDIIITKVGTPCYASILTDYSEIALSRTVMGLTGMIMNRFSRIEITILFPNQIGNQFVSKNTFGIGNEQCQYIKLLTCQVDNPFPNPDSAVFQT